MFIFYSLLFLSVVLIYIHVNNYYKTNNAIDYLELFEPSKENFEITLREKIPFSVEFNNLKKDLIDEYLAPRFYFKKIVGIINLNSKTSENKSEKKNNEKSIIYESGLMSETHECNFFYIDKNYIVKLYPPNTNVNLSIDELNKREHLSIPLKKNSILVVPSYWYYSFSAASNSEDPNESVELQRYSYITYPNMIANYLSKAHESVSHVMPFLCDLKIN